MATRVTPGQQELNELVSEYNARPDHLTAILKHQFKIPGHLGWLHIAQIDPEGKFVLLFYHPPPEGKEVRFEIPLNPPVKTVFEIKPRLNAWRAAALQEYKVPLRPTVDYYSPPGPVGPICTGLALCVLLFALLGWGYYADLFRAKITELGGRHLLPGAAIFAALMHFVLEPAYMYSMLQKHKTPWSSGWKWLLTTVAFGFPALTEFHDSVEYERISNVYARTDVGRLPPRVAPEVSQEKKDL